MQLKPAYRKFEIVLDRFEELTAWLSTPDAMQNMQTYLLKTAELRNLEPTASVFREYLALLTAIDETQELARDTTDAAMRELALEELGELRLKQCAMEQELDVLLLPKDPADDRNVIMEIRAGAGGEEAALFAADLFRMYSMYAQKQGYSIEPTYANETELGGYREIDFIIEGQGAYSKFKFERGVHRVQRIPQTESNGKIQTSTVTVAVLPEVDEVEVRLNPQDIKMESCKSSGAGGQHINKTESAVRLIHIPTGIVVECQEQRSQLKNREKALKMLEAKLYQLDKEARDSKIANERRIQVGTGERCERIRTYNFPQGRVTDHRIGLTLYHLERFLAGDMEEMISALRQNETEKLLEGNRSE